MMGDMCVGSRGGIEAVMSYHPRPRLKNSGGGCTVVSYADHLGSNPSPANLSSAVKQDLGLGSWGDQLSPTGGSGVLGGGGLGSPLYQKGSGLPWRSDCSSPSGRGLQTFLSQEF